MNQTPTTTRRDVVLLGSTGSIGTQTIDIVQANPDRFRIVGLAAGGAKIDLLADQAAQLGVPRVALADPSAEAALRQALAAHGAAGVRIETGPDAATDLAGIGADIVVNGMTGAIGLRPTLAALAAGSRLALANKESLIIGGDLVRAAAQPGQIVPVDSEHSALAQCLRSGTRDEVASLVLTASGGPFRGRRRDELHEVTPQEALNHPTWSMGPMVTTNSATLVNKGLELIEAHLLFDVPVDRIGVVIHPQSVVHSWVEFVDGSCIAQCSPPDMRLPIALALGWPERIAGAAAPVDITQAATWEFLPLDDDAFPAVGLARAAAARGRTYPAVFNAANEVAVEAFWAGRLRFTEITDVIAEVVTAHVASDQMDLDAVLAADSWARGQAAKRVAAGAEVP